jgi:hypothetical protein
MNWVTSDEVSNMDKKVIGGLIGAAVLGTGLYLLIRGTGYHNPGDIDPSVPETSDELEERMRKIAAYFSSLEAKYYDDTSLKYHLDQALVSIRSDFEVGIPLDEDVGYVIFIQQLEGYINYRETVGYITFDDFINL